MVGTVSTGCPLANTLNKVVLPLQPRQQEEEERRRRQQAARRNKEERKTITMQRDNKMVGFSEG